jgi:hypothetical protein
MLEAEAAPHLEPGERIVAGARVNQRGRTVGTGLNGGIGGRAGAVVGQRLVRPGGAARAPVGFPATTQMALALTDRRLMVFARGSVTGRPKDYLASLRLDEIADVEYVPGRIVPHLVLRLANGTRVELEALRIDAPEELAQALQEALRRRVA